MTRFIKDISDDEYRLYLIGKRIKKWMKGNKAPPFQINFYFTKRCNLKCRFCYYSGVDRKIDYSKELSKEELLKITKEGADFGIDLWYMAGGEPFCYIDALLPMMEIIKKNGKYGNVNTNGTLFTKENVKKMVELGWDEITISLNSAEAKVDDELRGKKGTFKKCIKGIKLIQKTKKRMGKEKPRINLHIVITNKNYDKLKEIVKLGYKLKVTGINFTHLMDDTKLVKEIKLNKEEAKISEKEAEKALELANKLGVWTNLKDYTSSPINENIGNYYDFLKKTSVKKDKHDLLSAICFEPWTQISIFSDGTTGICGVWNPAITKENVRKKGVKDIWYGKFFEDVRKRMIKQEKLDECEDCATSRIYKNEKIKNHVKNICKKQ
jgi:MoaA/NifB/PqqE/SkfB family radical SAM enzyme